MEWKEKGFVEIDCIITASGRDTTTTTVDGKSAIGTNRACLLTMRF